MNYSKIHFKILLVLAFAFINALTSCEQTAPEDVEQVEEIPEEAKQAAEQTRSSEEVKEKITQTFQKMEQAMEQGNPEQLAEHFTVDAFLKFPEQEPLQGRDAIAKAHQQMIEQGIKVIPQTDEVYAFDDMAFETGTYELKTKDGNVVSQGHYATLWKLIGDDWKIHRDLISSTKENSPVDEAVDSE